MIVYVLTRGVYSSEHIVGVFADEDSARKAIEGSVWRAKWLTYRHGSDDLMLEGKAPGDYPETMVSLYRHTLQGHAVEALLQP